jgi:antibiotic biosynthesis monooxygenase (ABM) superfamily enzyme
MPKQFPCPVTTVFSRRVRPGSESQYEEWLKGITQSSAGYEGSQGTTILRPGADRSEYIAIAQFDSAQNLERWMVSPERGDWLEKLESITLDSEEVSSLTGMERWFTLPDRSVSQAPPKYKSAALVVLGLYPLVLLLAPLLRSFFGSWPGFLQVLISLLISVSLMVWIVLPRLTRLFFGWLYPEHGVGREKR